MNSVAVRRRRMTSGAHEVMTVDELQHPNKPRVYVNSVDVKGPLELMR